MPQYYLPLIEFLKQQVTAFLREFVSTGRIPLDEVIEPKIEVRCTLTGGMCTPNCPYFSLEDPCQHRSVRAFAYTMGIMYVLLKINETNTVYERDFQTAITTGKRYSDYLEGWKPYDPIDSSISVTSVAQLRIERESTGVTRSYEELQRYINHLNVERKKKLKNINQMIEHFEKLEGKVPEILRIQQSKLQTDLTSPAELSFNDLTSILIDFVEDQSISEKLVKEVATYIIEDFMPVNNEDFPLSDVNVDINKLHEAIHKTKDIEVGSPKKWTIDRLNEFRNETDPYKKLLILNDELRIWKDYIVPKGLKITDRLIRAKVMVDTVFSHFVEQGTTYYILFSYRYIEHLQYLNKLSVLLCEVLDEILHIDYNVLFNTDQLVNQAVIINTDSDYLLRSVYNADKIASDEDRPSHEVYLELIKDYIYRVEVISCNPRNFENIDEIINTKGGKRDGLPSRSEDSTHLNEEGSRSVNQSIVKLKL